MLFVFMSQPDFACNPHALWEYVKDNTNHETAWLVKRDKKYYELLRRGVRCAVYDTVEGNALLKEADYVIMNPLVEHFKTYAFKSCRETPIKAASLGNDAGIYGAVRLIVGFFA